VKSEISLDTGLAILTLTSNTEKSGETMQKQVSDRSAVARVSEAPPEISRGAPHTLLAYYYELQ